MWLSTSDRTALYNSIAPTFEPIRRPCIQIQRAHLFQGSHFAVESWKWADDLHDLQENFKNFHHQQQNHQKIRKKERKNTKIPATTHFTSILWLSGKRSLEMVWFAVSNFPRYQIMCGAKSDTGGQSRMAVELTRVVRFFGKPFSILGWAGNLSVWWVFEKLNLQKKKNSSYLRPLIWS